LQIGELAKYFGKL